MAYQGWSNYETWNVSLWFMNDEHAYYELMRQLVLYATQQHKPGATPLPTVLQRLAARVFGPRTPDSVVVTEERSKVNWDEIAASLREEVETLDKDWCAVLEALEVSPTGSHKGILDAAMKFRRDHAPDDKVLSYYQGPLKRSKP